MKHRRRRRRRSDSEYNLLLGQSSQTLVIGADPVAPHRQDPQPVSKDRRHRDDFIYLMKDGEDYADYERNPQKEIDWSQVSQIFVDQTFSMDIDRVDRCPICLESPPRAPRLSSCGHVYCLPCMMRYMEKWNNNCALCHEPLYAKCPLVYSNGRDEPANDYLGQKQQKLTPNFQLYLRAKGGRVAVKSDPTHNGEVEEIPGQWPPRWDNKIQQGDIHCSMFIISEQDNAELSLREIQELSSLSRETKEEEDYYHRAIKEIKSRAEVPSEPEKRQETETNGSVAPRPAFYRFYQHSNDSRTFLSSKDIRMLVDQFGSYQALPTTLSANKVINTFYVELDADFFQRVRYLDHLPIGMLVGFVECDWTGIIREDVIKREEAREEQRRQKQRDREAEKEREIRQKEKLKITRSEPDISGIRHTVMRRPKRGAGSNSRSKKHGFSRGDSESDEDFTIYDYRSRRKP